MFVFWCDWGLCDTSVSVRIRVDDTKSPAECTCTIVHYVFLDCVILDYGIFFLFCLIQYELSDNSLTRKLPFSTTTAF